MNKEQLMKSIYETGFALVDLNLFLDSHPKDKMALDYFSEIKKQYSQLTSQYEMQFGPLTAFSTDTNQGWSWIDAPWPWELEV
jgi:spore coat protein JB